MDCFVFFLILTVKEPNEECISVYTGQNHELKNEGYGWLLFFYWVVVDGFLDTNFLFRIKKMGFSDRLLNDQ